MKEFWNTRYEAEEFAYGKSPNEFFKSQIDTIKPTGKVLFPAEGEGRNAVYAAQLGWEVEAFDVAKEGRSKAMQLADYKNVTINYQVGRLNDLNYKVDSFDAIVFVFAHVPPNIKTNFYNAFAELLKSNGLIIMEVFSTTHLEYRAKNPKVGGPGKIEMLFSKEEVKSYFPNFEILQLEDAEVELKEGKFHNGIGKVIRFVARKK